MTAVLIKGGYLDMETFREGKWPEETGGTLYRTQGMPGATRSQERNRDQILLHSPQKEPTWPTP